ncbi:hypothetical protein pEaSNUABM11_00046 [Erwinia phage pEa_SNUABM_11]|nr:hypothetical protein pEaSNUABM11_00046 [Erwinia phage pEa_SNUABM_11]
MLDQYVTLGEIIPPPETEKNRVLRDHIAFMRNHAETATTVVDPAHSYPDIHSFYAYCKNIGLEEIQIYPTMLLNDIRNPMQFTPQKYTSLKIPSATLVNDILSTIR